MNVSKSAAKIELNSVVISRHVGEFTEENTLRFSRALYDTCRQNESTCAIADIRLAAGTLTTFERFFIGVEMAKYWIGIPLAVVGYKSQALPDRFWENVVVNRGINAKVFCEPRAMDAAIDWLWTEKIRTARLPRYNGNTPPPNGTFTGCQT